MIAMNIRLQTLNFFDKFCIIGLRLFSFRAVNSPGIAGQIQRKHLDLRGRLWKDSVWTESKNGTNCIHWGITKKVRRQTSFKGVIEWNRAELGGSGAHLQSWHLGSRGKWLSVEFETRLVYTVSSKPVRET